MFTAVVIALLILAGAATAVGGAVLVAQRKRELGGGSGPKQLTAGSDGRLIERGLSDVRAGDIVVYEGRDFLVEGSISYDEDGHRWSAARLIDNRDVKWIIVGLERIGPPVVRLVTLDTELEVSGYPPEVLHAGGVRYKLDRRGTATCKFAGDVGNLAISDRAKKGPGAAANTVERCRWWLYSAAGDDTLILEQWGDEFRALRGTRVADGLLELIPGS